MIDQLPKGLRLTADLENYRLSALKVVGVSGAVGELCKTWGSRKDSEEEAFELKPKGHRRAPGPGCHRGG